jgi:hypothetical protein
MNSPLTSAALWTERYESLRRYVLEGRQRLQTQPLGLALWLAKGMAGWMEQWSRLAEATPPPSQPTRRLAAPLPGGWQEPLTMVLAQMTLGYLQAEARL